VLSVVGDSGAVPSISFRRLSCEGAGTSSVLRLDFGGVDHLVLLLYLRVLSGSVVCADVEGGACCLFEEENI